MNSQDKTPPADTAAALNALAERLREGDSTAIAEIWDRYGTELRRRARTRLRQYGVTGQAESMDICNAVLLDLVRKREIQIRNPGDLVRYVGRAIDNQVLDLLKTLTRGRRDIRRLAGSPVEDHNVEEELNSPSSFLMRDEILDSFCDELGKDGRRMVALYLANCSWKEIGEKLEISADTARMRWTRAVKSLRDRHGDES